MYFIKIMYLNYIIARRILQLHSHVSTKKTSAKCSRRGIMNTFEFD